MSDQYHLSNDKVTVVLGSQWGDEGKGKLVDILAQMADVCARCQGGNNAGHTIIVGDKKYAFHLLPSGLINPDCLSIIGNGVVAHLPSLFDELKALKDNGLDCEDRLIISDRAHLVFDLHQIVDGLKEVELGRGSIGTTRKGIGPAYSSKSSRSGVRVHHLLNNFEEFEQRFRKAVATRKLRYGEFDYDVDLEIQRYKEFAELIRGKVKDTVLVVNEAIADKKKVLVEGANALMLDLDFGTFPYVTSSSTGIGGVCTGLGIAPNKIGEVIGVVKAYTTRVGGGPFPTEQLNEIGEKLQDIGHEYGVTTGRKRRCGWLDLVVLKYSNMINGYTSLNLTKLDCLDTFESIQVGVKYIYKGEELKSFPADLSILSEVQVEYVTLPGWSEDISNIRSFDALPENCKKYVLFIENFLNVKVKWIGVGPSRDAMILIN
ncbi:adenylosuccinate synthase [Neoconidiobolus thromboides FSU 785]|nr:adenylosuccinate synthase [Neoconidiobolus thromboides FSU 785]